ncbi:hypothetical protein ACP1EM_002734 [Escherichia coli]|uniref:hypothetical protein n=1 Tax=Escherichia coli TaxID=562 RepID=UPI0016B913E6|nr:hypothetical protein [Escherichia coli]EFH7843248.1 hypothetical protein [Escherichia coli]EFJ5769874.1 hypothetical protein [Escherichia coli]EFK6854721.1 hypothetical protein [Escherichia coli]EGA3984935.1 hypothetical protein [Escherichia coli]EIM3171015.1 hypothetical protein [Escherichia coli]
MKIEYQDYGAVGQVVVTSTVLELRKHSRVVDAVLFACPGIVAKRSGLFFLKTKLSGWKLGTEVAYRVALQEAEQ